MLDGLIVCVYGLWGMRYWTFEGSGCTAVQPYILLHPLLECFGCLAFEDGGCTAVQPYTMRNTFMRCRRDFSGADKLFGTRRRFLSKSY